MRAKRVSLDYERPTSVRVGIVQVELWAEMVRRGDDGFSFHEDPSQTWARVGPLLRRFARDSSGHDARLVLLPEFSAPREILDRLRQWSRRNKATVVAGTHYHRTSEGVLSRCPIIVNGRTYYTEKQTPSPYETSAIRGKSLQPGNNVRVLSGTPVGTLAVAICADFLSDEFVAEVQAVAGEIDFLCVIACQRETRRYSQRMSNLCQNAHPGLYVLYANLDFDTFGDGHSAIYGVLDSLFREELKKDRFTDLLPENKVAELRNGTGIIEADCDLKHKRPSLPRTIKSRSNVVINSLSPNPADASLYPRSKKIRFVAFDLDGTLLRFPQRQVYSWPLVFKALEIPDVDRRALMRRFLSEEISYEQWCEAVAQLFRERHLTRQQLSDVASAIRPVTNLLVSIHKLRQKGIRSGIISGGIDTILHDTIPNPRSLFDFIFINKTTFSADDRFFSLTPTKYDFQGKAKALVDISRRLNIDVANIAFCGDGINDIHASSSCGLSISFSDRKKPLLEADHILLGDDLAEVVDVIEQHNGLLNARKHKSDRHDRPRPDQGLGRH